uniref:Gustatory receptor n=1 Tax=Anopheles dirus TaxID=7168 RepID=A0A182NZ66_9DIPT
MYYLQTKNQALYRTLLIRTFRMVIRLSQLSCTAPFPLDPYQPSTPHPRTKQVRIMVTFRRLLSAVLFGIVLGVPFMLYYHYKGQIHAYKIPLSIKLMYYMQALLQTAALGYVLLVYQFRASFHRFYFERLVHVLVEFGRPDIGISLRALQTNIRRLLLLILLQVIVVIAATLVRDRSWTNLLKMLIFATTQIMATSLTLQYLTVFGIVGVLLRQMNDTLESFLAASVHDEAENASQLSSVRITPDEERTIEKIRLLQHKLLQIVLRANGGEYGQLLIAILLTTFIFLNTELLQLYQGIQAGAFTFDVIGTKLINSALKFAMLLMFAFPNRMVQKQNLRALKVVYQLHSSVNGFRCHEITSRFITQTTLFLDKAHEAYGMISIDMTLILSIIGGLTNILVVLVQFSNAKTSCN